MTCDEAQGHLIDYLHDELDSSESRELTEHLATCAECALESCRLRADLLGIRDATEAAPGPSLQEGLRRRVEAEFTVSCWKRLADVAWRPVPAFALVVAALVPLAIWTATVVDLPSSTNPPSTLISDVDAATVWTNPELI